MTPRVVVNTRALLRPFLGVQRYLTELLARMGDRVDRIRPRGRPGMVGGFLWEQLRLPALLRGRLLWSPSQGGPLAVRRQVLTVHDLLHFDCPEGFTAPTRLLTRLTLPRLARRARRVICDSAFTRERLIAIARVPPEKVEVVYLGADPRFRPCPPDAVERARAALAIPTPSYFLSLSALEPRKNLPRLLAAWGTAQAFLPEDVWLVLAGEKGERQIFRSVEYGGIPPRVHWTGRVADDLLPALYSGARALVYPSLYEGFGLPPLEAMACGTPCIVSGAASLPEVTGDAGVRVDPLRTGEIVAAIRSVALDAGLRQRLSEAGRARAALFSWDRAAEETLSILARELAGGQSSS